MRTLVFATKNRHKIEEISDLLKRNLPQAQNQRWNIIGLADIQCFEEIPETSETIEGNALQKALFVSEHFRCDCFADDTALEVDALNGQPGVISARYAGLNKSYEDNLLKVLDELQGVENRKARFRTVIALIIGSNQYFFEGRVEGKIIHEKRGRGGFGYDPVFVPKGYEQTFAEMRLDEKNTISHRAVATMKLIDFLKSYPD